MPIYFISTHDHRFVRIGYARHPKSQLEMVQAGSPDPVKLVGVVPGGRKLEAQLHREFADHATHTGWYRFHESIRRYIEANADRAARVADGKRYKTPEYRLHRSSGQAVVTLSGRDYYLGAFGIEQSRAQYDQLVGEWLKRGRVVLANEDVTEGLVVVELIAAYFRFAQDYYVKNGEITREFGCIKDACRYLKALYGHTLADKFGPVALEVVRDAMVSDGLSRKYINKQIGRIRRMFTWACAKELVAPTVPPALATLKGLRKGRTQAVEHEPVEPVPEDVVLKTLIALQEVVADMVRFQRLTGCRPGEACTVRPCDIDRSGDIWIYQPVTHKTEHQKRKRLIFIGPQAQAVMRPYLLRAEDSFCFSPQDSERKRRAEQHAERKTPLSCGNRPGTNRMREPGRPAGDCYTVGSFRLAVYRACERVAVKRWSPNQLRHSAATEIRQRYGLEAAQVTLGHASANVTEVYAQRDMALAERVAREVG